jgi:hypothetical protein
LFDSPLWSSSRTYQINFSFIPSFLSYLQKMSSTDDNLFDPYDCHEIIDYSQLSFARECQVSDSDYFSRILGDHEPSKLSIPNGPGIKRFQRRPDGMNRDSTVPPESSFAVPLGASFAVPPEPTLADPIGASFAVPPEPMFAVPLGASFAVPPEPMFAVPLGASFADPRGSVNGGQWVRWTGR